MVQLFHKISLYICLLGAGCKEGGPQHTSTNVM